MPSPSDAGPDGPLATIVAARDACRVLADGPKRIVVRGGVYFLEDAVSLAAPDSGLTVEAAAGEEAILYGGKRIVGWQPEESGPFWTAEIPRAAQRPCDFRMLVVDGRFCQRARLPRDGFFTHDSEFDVKWMSTTGGGWQRKPTHEELTTLRYRTTDLGPWLCIENAELTVYHMWDESVVGLAALDGDEQILTFSNPSGHPPGAFGVRKYVVWNVREGMLEPGQWYLDRAAGKVVCWPLAGEDMGAAEAIAPTTESIIRLQGTEEAPVRDVTLRGLSLSVTNTPLAAGGFGAGKFEGAIAAELARDCRVEDVSIYNVGGQGIRAQNCTTLAVERCQIRDTGACGIIVRGDENVVADNHVHRVGITYPSAIGVWCAGRGSRICHNRVHHTPYTGIAAGGENHQIEGNLIYDVMRELHDGAGIYITFCKSIVLRGNFIRDIMDTGGYGASAYYLDEQAEQCLVEGNLSLRVGRPSHNHMASNNTIRNNVFIVGGDATLTFPRSSDYGFCQNVVCATGKIAFTNPDAIVAMDRNIVHSAEGIVQAQPLEDYEKEGDRPLVPRDGTLLTAPVIVECENGCVRFAPESPAHGLRIEAIDVSGAGPRDAECG